MKKLLLLLSSILISLNSYGGWFDKTICYVKDGQVRNGVIYLPNKTKPFTGNNLCKGKDSLARGKIKNGMKDGKWLLWDFKNKMILNYKDGKLDGKNTEWYDNGNKKEETDFKDDKVDGKYTKWYYNGNKKEETDFKDDKIDGKEIYWDERGQKRSEGNYKDGKKDGNYTEWYDNGLKKYDINFKDEKKDGEYKKWDDAGKTIWKLVFKDDRCVDYSLSDYSFGCEGWMAWNSEN